MIRPLEKPTVQAADLLDLKVTSTDISNYAEVNQALGPSYAKPEGFIDLCLASQDNRKHFKKMWGAPHFILTLEYQTYVYQFRLDVVNVLVWSSKKGTSIEIVNPVERTKAITVAMLMRNGIVEQLREWLPKNEPRFWDALHTALK